MNTQEDIYNKEINIDINKILCIFWYRRNLVLICLVFVVFFTILFTLFAPKKYTSSVELLIKNSSSTNLSFINPFIISDSVMSQGSSQLASFMGTQDSTENDIKLIKSPIVLDSVIRQFNFRYQNGERKGEYITAQEFIGKSLVIKNKKDSKLLSVSYKSRDPKLSYDIVNAIVESYKKAYENINSSKATMDREFLEKSYLTTKQNFLNKINKIKEFKEQNQDNLFSPTNENFYVSNPYESLLSTTDKRLQKQMISFPGLYSKTKSLTVDLEEEVETLKVMKSKYEWSILVENISKNVTNIIVLNPPRQPKITEFSEPNYLINNILALIIACLLSSFVVFGAEKLDNKLSYLSIGNDNLILDENKIKLEKFCADIILSKSNKIGMISLVDDSIKQKFLEQLSYNLDKSFVDSIIVASEVDNIKKKLEILDNELVILIAKVGYTSKEQYNMIIESIKKQDNITFKEVIFK